MSTRWDSSPKSGRSAYLSHLISYLSTINFSLTRIHPNSPPPQTYVRRPSQQNLVKGRRVRVRIVGTRVDANEIVCASHSPTQFAIGTMKEDYLGPFD